MPILQQIKKVSVVVPWHNASQLEMFKEAWKLEKPFLISRGGHEVSVLFPQDTDKSGCALTKNMGIEMALAANAEIIIVLDDDCYPDNTYNFVHSPMSVLVDKHLDCLKPQQTEAFLQVTDPPSRGTPYFERTLQRPVAASMGFWTDVGDYDAVAQLIRGPRTKMEFKTRPVFGQYFPLCGMNLAFRATWYPWCKFIPVPRFDDIWQGFLWQKKAYAEGYCFNLNGPLVKHSRQSNVWANLRDEAPSMERNETIWKAIANSKNIDYDKLKEEVGL